MNQINASWVLDTVKTMIDSDHVLIKWAYLCFDFSNKTTGRIISKHMIEMVSMQDIFIGLRFERCMGKTLESHRNYIGSLGVLATDLDFDQ